MIYQQKKYLLGKIKDCTIFSKFDCKSGFWQVKMHPDSIPWTAFSCPEGHFEWLVMLFGLKNAPSIFQRKMDNIFRDNDSFVAVVTPQKYPRIFIIIIYIFWV